jgi:hypothetical protein
LGHHAIESLVDLLSNPDQRRETTARCSGHDLAKGNGPRGLGLRPQRRRTNDSMSFQRGAADTGAPSNRIPDYAKPRPDRARGERRSDVGTRHQRVAVAGQPVALRLHGAEVTSLRPWPVM